MSRNVIENVIADFYAKKTDDSRQNYLDYQAGLIDIFGNPKGSTTTPNTQTQTQTEVVPDSVVPEVAPDTGVAQVETDRAAKINVAKAQLRDALMARPNFYENRTQANRRLVADEAAAKIVNTGENPYSFYGKDFNDTVSSILSSLEVKTPEIAPEVTPIDDTIEDIIGTPNMANTGLTQNQINASYNKILGRDVGPAGLDFYENRPITVADMEAELLRSEEYNRLTSESPKVVADDSPVTNVISGATGIYGDQQDTTTSPPPVPTEGLDAGGVRRLYENILFREADPTGLASRIGGDPIQQAAELRALPEALGPARIRQVYQGVLGRDATPQELAYYGNEFGDVVSRTEARDLVSRLRPDQLTRFRQNLGVPTLDYSKFNLAPTAGIERLLPAEANRTNTFYNLTQDPRFTAPDYGQFGREVEKARIADELGEGAGKSLFPLFQDVFGQDYKQGIRDALVEEITPGIRAQAEADIAAEQAAAEGGMYAGGLTTLSEANIFNEGGKVDNMGLQGLGQKMAAYGRYGDTMLAHISPEEAKMLKAMGGSGTRNPVTGLPEFFIGKLFKKLFKGVKKIAPFVLPFIPGFQGLSLMQQSLLAGGIGGLSGDGKFDLKRAITSGLTTYGVGSLAKAAGTPVGAESGGVGGGVGQGSTYGVDVSTAPANIGQTTSNYTGIGQSTAGASTAPSGVGIDRLKAEAVGTGERIADTFKGLTSGDVAAKEFITPGLTIAGGVAGTKAADEYATQKAEYEAIAAADAAEKERKRKLSLDVLRRNPFGYAQGGVSALPPRYLDGAGDGMSDSIKANIGGLQEARLADGEFVIPADVVADMGNGSSNAGAERLYSMMDRVREARHGTTKQPPEINVNRMMPA